MSKVVAETNPGQTQVLKVLVSGGGPVGLSFALLLESLMGNKVAIKVYDRRWTKDGSRVVWLNEDQGNARRQQVVTLQSRQYLKLPPYVQERIFQPGYFTEMWPTGPDSVAGHGPRNVRIAHIENQLLDIANEKPATIELIPARFDVAAQRAEVMEQHILAISEGGRSHTLDYFTDRFGAADHSMYSLDGQHLQDVVLGLRVKSDLPDAMAVLLTVAQNRFLLNSLRGEGFLNMRLTDEEVKEVVGIDLNNREFKDCIQSRPCVMERTGREGEFKCTTHSTLFLPAMLKGSALWSRIQEGLKLFGVKEGNLSAVTAFRLDMVQRPRFTAQLYPTTAKTPGTFGCLLGDTANAIHFWPGRGLNSGLASAVSLARSLKNNWRGRAFRDADFARHEALMSMLQYRHKSRAWRAMTTIDDEGTPCAIKNVIKQGITEGESGGPNKEANINELMARLGQIRSRLAPRLAGLPDDQTLKAHLSQLDGALLHTLVVSGAWDTLNVGGEEVEVDLFFEAPEWGTAHIPAPVVAPPSSYIPPAEPAPVAAQASPPSANTPPAKISEMPVSPQPEPPVVALPILDDDATVIPILNAGDDESTYRLAEQIEQPLIGAFVRVSGNPTLPNELPIYGLLTLAGEARKIHIGRHSKNNTVVINDKSISREHALLIQKEGRLYLADNGSTAGTFLNGRRLQPGQELLLRDNDQVRFGEVVYEFQAKTA